MPDIPAICDNCSAIFPSGIFVENVVALTMSNVTSGPCPVCGGMGRTLDGTFNVFGNAIQILSAPDRTYEELQRLAEALKKEKIKGTTKKELQENIKDDFPFMAPLLKLLTNQHVQAWTAIILTLINLLLDNKPIKEPENHIIINQEIKYEQVINQVYINNDNFNAPTAINSNNKINQPIRVEKVGRNEPCPCGSSMKYKKCHGR